jgi:hypothetical protein
MSDHFDELTPGERGWLLAVRNRLRKRDNLVMGTFAEHVVAERLPGSRLRTFSMATYDIDWEDISIEVKSSVQRQEGTKENDRPSAEKWEVRPHYGWDEDAGAGTRVTRSAGRRCTSWRAMKASPISKDGRSTSFHAGGSTLGTQSR